jgi:hypothetical protein
MAEGVVVLLEAVEVEEREGAPVGGRRLLRRVLEVAHQRAAVGQAGEAVGERLVAARTQEAEVLAEEHAAARAGDEQRPGGQQRRGEVHGGELADHEDGEGDGREGGGQRQRPAGDLLDPPARRGLPRGERRQRRPQGPQRVDPRPRDVGAHGRLVAEHRVGDDVGELPEPEQQPRAVRAPAVEAEGHHDERDQQDVADRVGEVEGDVDRVALGDPRQRGEHERGHHRGGGQAAHRAVKPLRGPDRAQARAQQHQQPGVDGDVAAEVQAVGDARVGRVVEVAEPQRPDEIAAGPEEQAEADERPCATLAAASGGREEAHRAADPHHAGVDPTGDRVVNRAVAGADDGVPGVHGEAEQQQGEDGADDPFRHFQPP